MLSVPCNTCGYNGAASYASNDDPVVVEHFTKCVERAIAAIPPEELAAPDVEPTPLWDPLDGCDDPAVARGRALDLMAPSGRAFSAEAAYWVTQGARVLATLLYLAACDRRRSMWDVACWVRDPDAGAEEIEAAVRMSPVPQAALDAAQFLSTNARTRDSISATIIEAVFAA